MYAPALISIYIFITCNMLQLSSEPLYSCVLLNAVIVLRQQKNDHKIVRYSYLCLYSAFTTKKSQFPFTIFSEFILYFVRSPLPPLVYNHFVDRYGANQSDLCQV